MPKSSELTIRDWVKLLVVTKFGARVFSRQELLEAWREEHPDIPESGVLPADYCVNTKTGRWTPPEQRFLFCVSKGKYRVYDPSRDGGWTISEWGTEQEM